MTEDWVTVIVCVLPVQSGSLVPPQCHYVQREVVRQMKSGMRSEITESLWKEGSKNNFLCLWNNNNK